MKVIELKDRLYWTGVLDPDLRVFDIIMRTEFGTTYNSYILDGSEKTALIETAKLKFFDGYLESVQSVCDIRDIDYIIVDHTEPDHAGSIEKLIAMNPEIKIVGTSTAIGFLKQIVNRDFYSIIVGENDTLSLGDKTLRFMVLPNLHWPDTMYTYVEEDKVLFTCDSFGSHYSHPGVLRSTVTDEEGYNRAAKYYFDNIIGPFKRPYMVNALNRIKDLSIDMICTGHGPVLDTLIPEFIATYRTWCAQGMPPQRKTVVMPYVSAYGYTGQLAEKIAGGIRDSGDIDVHLYDMVTSDPDTVSAEITTADGLLFGTPTIVGEALAPIWNLTTSMFAPVHKGKLASAFGSYGWSGEGVPHILERLKQLRLNVQEGFRIRFKPSDNELLDAYEYGYNFGCLLLDKKNDRKNPSGGRKLLKCLVCGEIFDASLEVCPVCGAGKERCVPVEENITTFRKDTEEWFVVIGGGAAGYHAAKAIRERNSTAAIVILSNEKYLPYNRPMLTKSMMAGFTPEQIAISGETWYADNRIGFLPGYTVTSIDTANKTVICENDTFHYDKLIYALGSENFIPRFKGSEKNRTLSIRTISDTEEIKKYLPETKNAVVIGGGVLGLEAAWELSKGGCAVTVLEVAPSLMPRQLDAGASAMLSGIAEASGLKLVTGASVAEITENAVTLEDGRSFEAQLVVVSCGVKANVAIASAAGITADRSIPVDDHMRTNMDGIYACGDCASFKGVNYALWAQAVEMGRVAGANAAGDDLTYSPVNGALTFNGLGTSLFAVGDSGKDSTKKYRTVEMCDQQRKSYEKYYFLNNRLSGVILLGDVSKMAEVSEAVDKHLRFSDVIKF